MDKTQNKTEESDFLIELKELAFASRLRRLSDRLGRDVGRIYGDLQIRFEAKWFTLFYLLSKYSPLSVTEAAYRLGLSHAAINKLSSQMEKEGLIKWRKSTSDERRRMLRLSAKGRSLAKNLSPVWEIVCQETKALIKSVDAKFLEQLRDLEKELDKKDMHQRVLQALNIKPARQIEILPYRPAFKKYFRSINEEWLKKYFKVESEDHRQLNDPNGQIIRRGGQILFAKVDGHIVGTCALVRHQAGLLELCKMGVASEAHGFGIGRRLAAEVAVLARDSGAEKLYLFTSPELKSALKIYEQLGFKRKKRIPLPECKYQRRTFAMELDLTRLESEITN